MTTRDSCGSLISIMRIDGPSNPFHLARAYGVAPSPLVKVTRAEQGPADQVAPLAKIEPTNTQRLIAGVVDAAPRFQSVETVAGADRAAIAMYRHPADKNAAATGVVAGRTLDIKA